MIVWLCNCGHELKQTHAVYTHFWICSTTDQQQGRQSSLLHTERERETARDQIYTHIRGTHTYRSLTHTHTYRSHTHTHTYQRNTHVQITPTDHAHTAGESEILRMDRLRKKDKNCHLTLNEGKESADRNKLSESYGPLRTNRHTVEEHTEVQEEMKEGWTEE